MSPKFALSDRPLAKLTRFGGVGIIATALYVVVTWLMVEWVGLAPVEASLSGFFLSVPVSYIGQKFFTFRSGSDHREELPKFFVTTSLAFCASTFGVMATVGLGFHYMVGVMAAALLVPLLSFLVMNYWVFR